ncbi:MAG: hypothetical protein O3A92_08550 [Verrucomicrobia bacterium]|nr:hypothetical protein [Verrucomicrobiota bacterium]
MNPLPLLVSGLLGCLLGPLAAQEVPTDDPDLLRFNNGDALHGRFLGMDDGNNLTWTGSSIKTPIILQSPTLRRLALNGGRAAKALSHPQFIELVNGDRIPGSVVTLEENTFTIDTPMGKTLTLDRKFVRSISPNPFGGVLAYMGPFSKDDWSVIEVPPAENAPRARRAKEVPKDGAKEEEPWVFGGDAWYSNSNIPIAVDAKIPDKARIAFHLAWRSRLSAVVAFHATLKIPEPKPPKDGEEPAKPAPRPPTTSTSSYPLSFGHSYVLTLYSTYAMLYRCDFDENGNSRMNRLASSSATIRLDERGEAKFELRCDRANNSIILYVDGEYINQWEDPEGYSGTGSHLAFACQNNDSRLRVSDVVVSSWNGMIDSARSLEAEDRDVILLNNGTDRFSGHITGLENGRYLLKGSYADMQIPTEEVEEIRFANANLSELPDVGGKALRVILRPVGRITIDPHSATSTEMKGRHPAFGELTLDLGYASLLEFSFSDSILDSWDDNF